MMGKNILARYQKIFLNFLKMPEIIIIEVSLALQPIHVGEPVEQNGMFKNRRLKGSCLFGSMSSNGLDD